MSVMFDKAAFEVCDGFMNEVSFYSAAKLRKVRLVNIPCILSQNCYSLTFRLELMPDTQRFKKC